MPHLGVEAIPSVVGLEGSARVTGARSPSRLPFGRIWRLPAFVVAVQALAAGPPAFAAALPLAPQDILGTHSGAFWIAPADVDGDGDLDLAYAAFDSDEIGWFDNDGAQPPSFTDRVVATGLVTAARVHPADLDADGDVDLLVAAAIDIVLWLENNGASPPAFMQRVIDPAADGAFAAHAGDLDRDGDIDVVAASALDHTIAWHESDGASPPAFTKRVILTGFTGGAAGARDVHLSDLDGDGDLDIAAAASIDDKILWLENQGGAPLGFLAHTIVTGANGAHNVWVADLDQDGDADVLSVHQIDNEVAWHENDGASPPSFTMRLITTLHVRPSTAFPADLDQDGDLDVLVANGTSDNVTWYESNGASPPVFTYHLVTTLTNGARHAVAADLDNDGDPDLASASQSDHEIAWYENRSIGRNAVFPERVILDTSPYTTSPSAAGIALVDLDGDGDRDVLGNIMPGFSSSSEVLWWENRPGLPFTLHAFFPGTQCMETLRVADLDRDGDPDILGGGSLCFTAQAESAREAVARSPGDLNLGGATGSVWWHQNDGTPAVPGPADWTTYSLEDTLPGCLDLLPADLNGDGFPDVVAFMSGRLVWYENLDQAVPSGPSAWTRSDIDTGCYGGSRSQAGRHGSIEVADVDQDGDLDVVSACRDEDIAWHENTAGDGSAWSRHVISGTADFERHVALGDLDRDGDLDVVSASDSQPLRWHEGSAGGSSWVTRDVAPDVAGRVALADLDLDGDLDIVSAPGNGTGAGWYASDAASPPGFEARPVNACAGCEGFLGLARFVGTGDVDGDGDPDYLTTHKISKQFALLLNQGGQYALAGEPLAPVAPRVLLEGEETAVHRLRLTHNGRAGDEEIELASLPLRLEASPGVPLTPAQANALLQQLDFYVDDGSGAYEPALDMLLHSELVLAPDPSGRDVIALPDGVPGLQVGASLAADFFVVARAAIGGGSAIPNTLLATAIGTEAGIENAGFDIPAWPETPLPDITAGPTQVVPDAAGSVLSGEGGGLLTLELAENGDLLFDWPSGCDPGDTDYEVYEGVIGDFASHVPRVCTTGGATDATLTPEPGNRYYLVVPVSGSIEGSHGLRSDGSERPAGPVTCLPQAVAVCP